MYRSNMAADFPREWTSEEFRLMRSYSDKLLERDAENQDSSTNVLNSAVMLNVNAREGRRDFDAPLDNGG